MEVHMGKKPRSIFDELFPVYPSTPSYGEGEMNHDMPLEKEAPVDPVPGYGGIVH